MNYLLKLQKVNLSCRFLHTSLRSVSNVFPQGSCSSIVQKKLFLRLATPCISSSRTFWETFPYLTRSLYARDGFKPEEYELVLRNPVFNYLFYGQIITQSAIAIQIGYALYYAFQVYYLKNPAPVIDNFGGIPITYSNTSFIVLWLFNVQTLCVYHCIQLMALRVYHKLNSNEHVVVSMSHLPFILSKTVCKKGDVEYLNVEGYKAFFGNFRCSGKRFFINYSSFKSVPDYISFLGNNDEEEE